MSDSILDHLKIRPSEPNDLNFILNTWLTSYKNLSAITRRIKSRVFFTEHEKLIKKLIETGKVIVACDQNAPDILVGYLAYKMESFDSYTLHYLFVKPNFRRQGIARYLLQSIDPILVRCEFTHWTDDFTEIRKQNKQIRKLTYNPYRIYNAKS